MSIKDITRMYAGDMNCGIVELQIITGKTYQEIKSAWPGGWDRNDGFGTLGLPNDTPEDHYAVLKKLGIPYKKINVNEVLNHNAKPCKTALLMHMVRKPNGWWEKFRNLFRGFFRQHWVVYLGYNELTQKYRVDWLYWKFDKDGNKSPDIRELTKAQMIMFLKASYPRCAYVVGEGQGEQSWIKRLFACFT